jgi:hypothetical protein
MALKTQMMAGTTMIGTHAPMVNLVMPTIKATTPVAVAPTPLIMVAARHPGSFSLRCRRTMADWLRVKEVKTPMAYSGMRAVVTPPKAMMRPDAATARKTTPLENTRRSPRLVNCRGRKPSRAMNDDRRGKSAYAVLAARTRMAAVANCRTQ